MLTTNMADSPLTKIGHYITIWFFTYVGVLWRVAMTTLCDNSDNAALRYMGNNFFVANLIGSFIMGLAYALTDLFKPYQSWHIGITVGFCGSCTTFSTWQRSVAIQLLGKQWIIAIIQLFVTYVGSYSIFCHGLHLGKGIKALINKRKSQTKDDQVLDVVVVARQRRSNDDRFSLDLLILLLVTVLITGALWCGVFLDDKMYRKQWWTALAMAPLGSFIRFSLSTLNPRYYPTFPLFTFLVNAVGSALSMSVYVGDFFLRRNNNDQSYWWYDLWINQGLAVGILGSLTTVSTFVKEIYILSNVELHYAYRYAAVSVLIAQLCCVTIGCAIFAVK